MNYDPGDKDLLVGGAILGVTILVAVLGKLYLGKLIGFITDLGAALFRALPDILAGIVIGGSWLPVALCFSVSTSPLSRLENVGVLGYPSIFVRCRSWLPRSCDGWAVCCLVRKARPGLLR